MKFLRFLLYLLIALVGAFLIFLLYATIDDYKPQDIKALKSEEHAIDLSDSASFKLVVWNLGYAGLDASMDFFYDGGEQMRPSAEQVGKNMAGILATLSAYLEYDFILLQEVDRDSKRSYHVDQQEKVTARFPAHLSFYAKNYDVFFVPIPLLDPMGKVESGLLTLSMHVPSRVERYSFPGNYKWPVKVFMLDRCFLMTRLPLNNGKELLVINTHNSAYDDGSLRQEQMDYLKGLLLEEYEKGNYLLVGGDWNQSPYGLETAFPDHIFDTENLSFVEKDYPAAGWTWAYDTLAPTNRRVKTPYDPSTSATTLIDFYLLSPNIRVQEVRTRHLDFRYSDHQPVELKIQLIP